MSTAELAGTKKKKKSASFQTISALHRVSYCYPFFTFGDELNALLTLLYPPPFARNPWTSWWRTCTALTHILSAVSFPTSSNSQVSLMPPWSWTSCNVTVYWKESVFAGKDSLAGLSTLSSNRGKLSSVILSSHSAFYVLCIIDSVLSYMSFVYRL